MSYEKLGLDKQEQAEIHARGVMGAADDVLEGAEPIVFELAADEDVKAIVDDMIHDAMQATGMSEPEARLALAEYALLERATRKDIQDNGEDF
ncbi:hypothetical protein HYS84_02755 [Candidatus Saccharibacteria bacterium]|nr:hypothetical protein [Candidatus Saccharibacteria bacterium]